MTNKTKIAYVITDSGVGGTENALSHIIGGLNRSQFEIVGVVVLKSKKENAFKWEKDSIEVVSLQMNRWPTMQQLKILHATLDRWNPHIVHALLFHSIQLCRLVRMAGLPFQLISSPRVNYKFAPFWALVIDRILRKWDNLVLTESEASLRNLTTTHGYEPAKCSYVMNGVDSHRFSFDAGGRKEIRAQYGISENEILIGSSGRLHKQKRFDIFIEAIGKLRKKHPQIRPFISGDGPERSALLKLSDRVEANLILSGIRNDMPQVLSAFDIYVQSSDYEGMSNALLEALSVGLPIVATNVDGTQDVIQNGINGFTIPPGNIGALALAVEKLLNDSHLKSQIGGNARTGINKFDIGTMISGFEKAYISLTQKK